MPHIATRARPTGHPGYSETLPRRGESAAAARRLLRTACAAWELDDLAEDGALIVSELVANAVRHARRECIRVVVDRPGAACIRIGVVDFCKVLPVGGTPGSEEECGRGLVLVAALAGCWGADPLPWGKRVWAELYGTVRA
ncbi:ATP-binding protein [Streptomyces erythrochromogenes]|uniref:ATP-binding protein n=1 Tax=Streptomyces erythrochromogenes TaxID=285574 RepID=UPI0036F833E4